MGRLAATLAALCVGCIVTVGVPPVPALGAAPACPDGAPSGGRVLADTPWPQQRYDFRQIAPLATGAGITVAVIDSGVDNHHPQLAGRVIPGADLLDGGDGRLDCVGHGTEVASIIAARTRSGSGLRGLAPGVSILPIRITELRDPQSAPTARDGSTADLARAIRTAVQRRVDVINLSLSVEESDPALESAVAEAIDRGIVVVAAVGNGHDRGDPTPYPAAYPGVIGVGAINRDGTRWASSQVGSYVDIVAPGSAVVGAVPVRGHALVDGTSFATPFVSATVALLLQYHRGLSPAEVSRRLVATADPSPGNHRSDEYGYGVLNPLRAITAVVPAAGAKPAVPPGAAHHGAAAARLHGVPLALAGGVATGLVVVAGVLTAIAIVAPLGRRRRWRPGRLAVPAPAPPVEETRP
jgi:membrane-anchored mycosin MYCP